MKAEVYKTPRNFKFEDEELEPQEEAEERAYNLFPEDRGTGAEIEDEEEQEATSFPTLAKYISSMRKKVISSDEEFVENDGVCRALTEAFTRELNEAFGDYEDIKEVVEYIKGLQEKLKNGGKVFDEVIPKINNPFNEDDYVREVTKIDLDGDYDCVYFTFDNGREYMFSVDKLSIEQNSLYLETKEEHHFFS